MAESDNGQFSGQITTIAPGVYRVRIRARGATMSGEPFTREKTLTPAVWRGGDRVTGADKTGQVVVDYLRERDARLCQLLTCLLQRGGLIGADLEQRLHALGVDISDARKCLEEFCHGK
jgi:hypothetical protein